MPLYDFECQACGWVQESIERPEEEWIWCPKCGGRSYKIISASGQYCGNDEAPWVRKILEVVDKDCQKPETQEFLKHPTKNNYKRWMKANNLRHFELGERTRPEPVDTDSLIKAVLERRRNRNRIEVR